MTALGRKQLKQSAAARAFRKVRLQSVSHLKKKADAAVSIHVRSSAADEFGMATCYTCGKRDEWRRLQCGHFISRAVSATRYDLDNLRVQCYGCNVWGRGRINIFAPKLLEELGTKRFKALLERGRTTHQFDRKELTDIIHTYQSP